MYAYHPNPLVDIGSRDRNCPGRIGGAVSLAASCPGGAVPWVTESTLYGVTSDSLDVQRVARVRFQPG